MRAEAVQLAMEGLKEAGVSIVCYLPDSHLKELYEEIVADPDLRSVCVTNEGEGAAICGGVWASGKRAVMIMENSGLRQACEPIARFAFQNAMPMVIMMSYRGEWGEQNWWGHNHTLTMEPLLNTLRIPSRHVSEIADIKPAIMRAFKHADGSNGPVALIFGGNCVEVPAYAKD